MLSFSATQETQPHPTITALDNIHVTFTLRLYTSCDTIMYLQNTLLLSKLHLLFSYCQMKCNEQSSSLLVRRTVNINQQTCITDECFHQNILNRGVTIHVPFDSIRFRLLPFGFDYSGSIMQNINDF